MMARMAHFLSVVLLLIRLSRPGSTDDPGDTKVPFEEDPQYDCYQYAKQVMDIKGKIYVMKQNFNATPPPLCDSAEVVEKINDTYYVVTLAAIVPMLKLNNTLVKFNTSFALSKTGNHSQENAMTYKYTTTDMPKLRKLMYLSPNKTCMIFVDDRNSTDPARCQLLMPREHANNSIPSDCQTVYNSSCSGDLQLTVYQPWCQNLPEISVQELLKRLNTTPPADNC
ncbi:uncharacterized protein LOC119405132 [Rhipicephalus sanguineus]|uniref:uncharacterized protein LOC119405132 n=1 Tax=Rhipicephalus sanguineus TaxID=34632 RepID=UPI0018958825|nr:uncharacterized protein LOC119405132 [Rhipicephalus sanguineus]